MREKVHFLDRFILPANDHRRDYLIALRIGHPDDIGELHGRMGHEDLFNFDWGDVDSTGLDHLLRAATKMQTAFGVEITKVTSQEKTIGIEGFAGFNLVLEVSDGDVTLHANFPDLSARESLAGIAVDDTDIYPRKRTAHTVASYLQRLGCIRDAAISIGLREAVNVADLAGAEVNNAHDLLRRADGATGAQASEVIIATIGMIEKRLRHVWRPIKQSATLRANQA